jgi:hypothetical protein
MTRVVVTVATPITRDGVTTTIPVGTVLEVPAGSTLATALSGSTVALNPNQTVEGQGGPGTSNRG